MSEQQATEMDAQTGDEYQAQAAKQGASNVADARRAGVSRGPSRLALVLALIALLAVGGGLFAGYRYWSEMQQSLEQLNASLALAVRDQAAMGEHLAQTHQAFEQQQQQIAAQGRSLAEERQGLEQERESMRQQGLQLNRSLAEMQQRLGGRQSQWRVAEAEYLIRLANHRLILMGDPATALAALSSADERLRDSGDPGWTEVRQTLAQEMSALKAVPTVDRAGLHASLSALMNQVELLALRDEGVALQPRRKAATPAGEDDPAGGLDLERWWRDLWDGFTSMMVIRHHDRPITAMLPPEQRYFLTQNLRLKLEGAKAALMGRNALLYSDNLNSAVQWIERYFATGSSAVDSFNGQLSHLAQAEIAPDLPDISASLRQLQSSREQLNQGESQ